MNKKIQVIYWRYFDGSSQGIVRGYSSLEKAELDLIMLQELGDGAKDFRIQEVYLDETLPN